MVKLRFHRGGKSGSYLVAIPKNVVEALGWREGMELEVRIIEVEGRKAVTLVPKSS